ncbi:MAG TPA: protein kinase [Solirubrobacterales bacterium]|jgi:serine/threonine-protein kinase|nr:protein kinase [Solirubrobacterales bacterium]
MSGSTIANRYMLGDRLGSGGMSTVYQATDRVLERTVAVKVLAEHLSDDEKFVARFRREALAVAKLVHPNIVQVYDTGVDAGRHFIVMEYVEGRSGAQLLQRDGALEPATAVEIAAQACAGLEYAHRMGIIHRDVKPGNLMVIGGPAGGPPEMTVKLADFGIARAAEQTRLTQVGSVVGTAAYLSPEQSRGEEATPISDVYSLGVVTYQLLTARLPYEGNSLAELAIRRENERPLPPTSYEKNIPEGLSQAVLRALENEPEDRYVDALAYGAALRAGLAGIAPAAEATTRLIDPRSTAATRVAPREPRTPTSPARAARPRRTSPPPRRPAITSAARPPRRRSRFSSFMRAVFAILMIAIVAGLIAAVILLATDAGQSTDLGQYIGDNFDQSISDFKQFIQDNLGN